MEMSEVSVEKSVSVPVSMDLDEDFHEDFHEGFREASILDDGGDEEHPMNSSSSVSFVVPICVSRNSYSLKWEWKS